MDLWDDSHNSDEECQLDSHEVIARFDDILEEGEEMSGINEVAGSLGVSLPAGFLPNA